MAMQHDIQNHRETTLEEEPSDLNFVEGDSFHIDIPNDERPAESRRQVHSSGNQKDKDFVPDLNGRTLEEVEREAERVALGQYFTDWDDFNRCMDSWGVMQGRRVERYASKPDFAVRTCRYGKTNRNNSKKSKAPSSTGDDADTELDNSLKRGLKKATATSRDFNEAESENSQGVDDDYWTWNNGDWSSENLGCVQNGVCNKENDHAQLNTSQQIISDSIVTLASRQPLSAIQGNTLANPISLVRTAAVKDIGTQVRSIVYGAKAWSAPRKVSTHGRKKSKSGACGELGRCPPPPSDYESDGEFECCPFRVRAQREATSGRIYISKCELKHTCARLGHKWRGPTHKAKWLGVTLAPRITRNPKVPIKELETGLNMDFRKKSNYKQMWRAKDLVRDWYLGGQRASFHHIPYLLERIVQVDPSSIVNWCTEDYKDIFKRAFICPSAMRGAMKYCQPMICLDAAHTKNRMYPTQLFLATTMDGNGRVVILCYAVAPVENKDNWVWFLEHMHRAIAGVDDPNLLLMSDRQKGLLPTVREVFPGKIHAHCANHLRANVKKLFGKGAEDYFLGCVYANTKEHYEALLDRLVKSTTKGFAAATYIRKIDTRLYARHAVELARMGKVSSNPAEQANSGLLSIREFAPFKLLLEMWYYMQTKQNLRRAEAGKSRDILTGPAHRRHEYNLQQFGHWQVADDGASTAKVWSTAKKLDYLVRLQPRLMCTCYKLQDMLWPCQHIMAWDDKEGRDSGKRFSKCWKITSLRALYAPTIPCFLTNDLRMSPDCFPPNIAVKRGRHRVVRMEGGRSGGRQLTGDDVEVDANGNLLLKYPIHDDPDFIEPMPTIATVTTREASGGTRKRKGGPHVGKRKCGLCGRTGHNRRSCVERLNDPRDVEPATKEETVDLLGEDQLAPTSEDVPLTAGAPAPTQSTGPGDGEGDIQYPQSTSDDGEHGDLRPENYELGEWEGDGGFVDVGPADLDFFENVASGVNFQFQEEEEGPTLTSDIVL